MKFYCIIILILSRIPSTSTNDLAVISLSILKSISRIFNKGALKSLVILVNKGKAGNSDIDNICSCRTYAVPSGKNISKLVRTNKN